MKRLSVDDVGATHPVRKFCDFWTENLNDAGLMVRDAFKPMMLPKILPWMVILDVARRSDDDIRAGDPWRSDQAYDFIYRLCGTGFAQLIDADMTGKIAGSRQSRDQSRQTYGELEACMTSKKPMISGLKLPLEDRSFHHIIRALFPVTQDGTSVTQIFGVVALQDFQD